MEKTEISVPSPSSEAARLVFGVNDETRKMIERELPVALKLRDEAVIVVGARESVQNAAILLGELLAVAQESLRGGRALNIADVTYLVRQTKAGPGEGAPAPMAAGGAKKMLSDTIVTTERGKPIGPRTAGQKEYVDALRRDEMVFAIGPAGTGKCIAADSLIATGQGLVPIGELGRGMEAGQTREINLQIAGRDGVEVASHLYCGGESETLKFETRLGFEIETTPEHPLLVWSNGELKWRCARQLQVGDRVALRRGTGLWGEQMRVDFEPKLSPHDHCLRPVRLEKLDKSLAYMLGVLTGDGCLRGRNIVSLATRDAELVRDFEALAARFGLHVFKSQTPGSCDYTICSSQLRQLLLHLGMSDGKAAEKRVPHAILRAPAALVAAFLRGLFDADATVEKRDGVIGYSTVSPVLARQVQTLLLNMGIVAGRAVKRGRYLGRVHLSQLVTLAGENARTFDDLIGFGLGRKRERRVVKRFNPNVDLVPVQIEAAAHRKLVFAGLAPSSKRLSAMCLEEGASPTLPGYANLCKLEEPEGWKREQALQTFESQNVLLLPITSITPGQAQVFDLTVPGSHSFVANGFVNHNTYMAVAAAVAALKSKQVARVILTRPAVEAGERLGFLPGDLEAKIDPYLRPLYDALYDMIDMEKAGKLFERKVIEVAPLAYMRGRTLNDAFVILDEAQNATGAQMKMFLTRMGFGSRMVITGDVTQTDLPRGEESGLKAAARVLPGVQGISFVYLGQADVVRHNLVQRVIEAYDKNDYPERL